jgi:hypothetical protein
MLNFYGAVPGDLAAPHTLNAQNSGGPQVLSSVHPKAAHPAHHKGGLSGAIRAIPLQHTSDPPAPHQPSLDPVFDSVIFPEGGIGFENSALQRELASLSSLHITVVVRIEESVPAFAIGSSPSSIRFSAAPIEANEIVIVVSVNGATAGASFGG